MKTARSNLAFLALLSIILLLGPSSKAIGQGLASIQLTGLKAESRNGNVGISWKTSSEKGLRQFEIEYSRDGNYFQNLGFIPARNRLNGDIYEFEHPVLYSDSAFYRIKIVDQAGRWMYTPAVLFNVNKITAQFVYPSLITTSILNMFLQDSFNSLEVVSLNGSVMLKQNLDGKTGRINIPLSPGLSPGMYIVQVNGNDKTITQKVIIQ